MSVQISQYRAVLNTYLKPLLPQTVLLLVLLLGGTGLTLLNPQILSTFIDRAVGDGDFEQLLWLALAYLLTAIIVQLVTVAGTYLAADIGLRATNRLRSDLTLHCLNLDMTFHNQQTPGELIERIDGDVSNLNNFLSTFGVQLLRSATLLIGILWVLGGIDVRISLLLGAGIVIAILAANKARDVAVPVFREEREESALLYGFIEERLSGMEDVRANGGTDYVMGRFYERSRAWFPKFVRSHTVGAAIWTSSSVIFTVIMVVGIGCGVYLFQSGAVTIGSVYLIYRYVELLKRPIDDVGRQMQNLQQAGASIVRIGDLLRLQPTIVDDGQKHLVEGSVSLSFDDVSFAYTHANKEEPPTFVLHNLSFRLEAGRVLGLLGRTGSGKTTLTRLLFRFYDPAQGSIRLNDVDLREYSYDSVRSQIGLVTQDVQLFHASVRQNLTLFDPAVPDDQIVTAIREVGLWDWFQALPQGLDTLLAPGGSGLSAGQSQLLAFARVMLKDPGLVILDEATSRLDPATEHLLEKAVDKLLKGRTAIIVAHRLATVQRADQIMVLENGHLIEFGEQQALRDDTSSRFAQLLQMGIEETFA